MTKKKKRYDIIDKIIPYYHKKLFFGKDQNCGLAA